MSVAKERLARLTVWCLAPTTLQCVQIGAADTTVGDLDVDIVLACKRSIVFVLDSMSSLLTPLLGLKLPPLHVALDGLGVMTEPAFELVIGTRHCCCGIGVYVYV
jgi:hypothetical protein